jgi:hypothetical protein
MIPVLLLAYAPAKATMPVVLGRYVATEGKQEITFRADGQIASNIPDFHWAYWTFSPGKFELSMLGGTGRLTFKVTPTGVSLARGGHTVPFKPSGKMRTLEVPIGIFRQKDSANLVQINRDGTAKLVKSMGQTLTETGKWTVSGTELRTVTKPKGGKTRYGWQTGFSFTANQLKQKDRDESPFIRARS